MTTINTSALTYTISAAKDADLKFLPAIEESAATLFGSDPALIILANDEPMSMSQHQEYLGKWQQTAIDLGSDTGTWIAVAHADDSGASAEGIVAFIVTQPLQIEWSPKIPDSKKYRIHIKELSVHANHQRRGVASKLIGRVRSFMEGLHSSADFEGLSLTTFRDVPFNGPFYARFGFRELIGRDDIWGSVGREGLQIWDDEQAHFAGVGNGSLRERRCWMNAA